MKIVEVNANQIAFGHKYGNWSIKVCIPLNLSWSKREDKYNITISFNPISSLYNEDAYEKNIHQPFNNTIWYPIVIPFKRTDSLAER